MDKKINGKADKRDRLHELINEIKGAILDHMDLQYMSVVLNALAELIDQVAPENNSKYDHVLYSHLEAIRHCLRFYLGEACETSKLLDAYIKNKVRSPKNKENNLIPGNAIQKPDDRVQEKRMVEEQKYLDGLMSMDEGVLLKKFLFDTWAYLIREKLPSKKYFLSYAWAKEVDDPSDEAWSQPFLAKLVEHLIQSGMQVYFDQYHSGAGNSLGIFMGKIVEEQYLEQDEKAAYEIDHVFIVSSRTIKEKLVNPNSGCSCEYKFIQKRMEEEIASKFIIPIQLNLTNYLPT